MVIETAAKVNLCLELLSRRPDGYHELATVFLALDLCDRIALTPAERLDIVVRRGHVPAGPTNLCHRAATRLAEVLGREPTVRITLDKRIPVGAGLGGGSGNAAGVLGALARLWQVEDCDLAELAAELGSDVAFFLEGGAAIGRGRGEDLVPLPTPQGWRFVVLAPAASVSTAAVYRAVQEVYPDGFRPEAGEATERLASALRAGILPPPKEWLINDLEEPAARLSAAVRADREHLAEAAPGAFRLSGSGGAWFLPIPEAQAETTAAALRALFPQRQVWNCRPLSAGWRTVSGAGEG